MSTTKVQSCSVDPRKVCIGVKYYVIHSCIHQNHILRLQLLAVCMRAKKNRARQLCLSLLMAIIASSCKTNTRPITQPPYSRLMVCLYYAYGSTASLLSLGPTVLIQQNGALTHIRVELEFLKLNG